MKRIDDQSGYWNSVAADKEFTHPVNLGLLRKHVWPSARILDYGCGYGRVGRELAEAGFRNVLGVDSSAGMIRRGRELHPGLTLEVLPESGLDFPDGSFDAVLLIALLTCVPSDSGQRGLMEELTRALRPEGLIYISDYLIQDDERNRLRYRSNLAEFGTFGVFRLPEGAVVRHHSSEWMASLTAAFETLDMSSADVATMNGNRAKAFQYLGRKRPTSRPRGSAPRPRPIPA